MRLTRAQHRVLRRLAADLGECSDEIGARLCPPRWWEHPAFARAMVACSPCGAAAVFALHRTDDPD